MTKRLVVIIPCFGDVLVYDDDANRKQKIDEFVSMYEYLYELQQQHFVDVGYQVSWKY
jgi:predicted ATPase